MPLPSDLAQSSPSPFAHQLIQSGYLNLPQMQQVLLETRQSGRPLLEVLEAITGHPLPPTLLKQYKEHQRFNLKILHGVEFPELNSELVELATIQELIDTLIPLAICLRHNLLPLKILNTQPPTVVVAMVDPSDFEFEKDIKRLLREKAFHYQRVGIMSEDYEALIKQCESQQAEEEGEETWQNESVSSQETLVNTSEQEHQRTWQDKSVSSEETLVNVTKVFEGITPNLPNLEPQAEEDRSQNEELQEAPVVNLVNKIILKALQSKASELHIEPQENCLSVRMRQDGLMRLAFAPLPKQVAAAVVSRLKVMANLDISKRQIPQQARLHKTFCGKKLTFLMHTLPSRYGEKVVLRIFNNSDAEQKLASLIADPPTLELVRGIINHTSGLFLVTGLTRTGKSTTLYALLEELNRTGVNIATVEDMIEQSLPGITQVEVNREKGMDYAQILQSFLTQDVDVMLVDQIQDKEIANKVVEAASKGHLVLTSLPAQNPASAIARLSQLVNPHRLSETLIGVMNQRLLRRICPTCRLAHKPSSAEKSKFRLPKLDSSLYKAHTLSEEALEQANLKGRLCRQCNGIGYQGQVGVYEVWPINARLKEAIAQTIDGQTLKQLALHEGMKSSLSYALNLAVKGETTLEEIERVFGDDLESALVSESIPVLPAKLSQRLQTLEQLLITLTQEFQQLKQELEPSPTTPTVETPLYEQLKEPETWTHRKQELDLSKETIASGALAYEELRDPGDWEELRRELETDKETIAADFPPPENDKTSRREINPFTQVPDPWKV